VSKSLSFAVGLLDKNGCSLDAAVYSQECFLKKDISLNKYLTFFSIDNEAIK
jgi:hypothetical protein